MNQCEFIVFAFFWSKWILISSYAIGILLLFTLAAVSFRRASKNANQDLDTEFDSLKLANGKTNKPVEPTNTEPVIEIINTEVLEISALKTEENIPCHTEENHAEHNQTDTIETAIAQQLAQQIGEKRSRLMHLDMHYPHPYLNTKDDDKSIELEKTPPTTRKLNNTIEPTFPKTQEQNAPVNVTPQIFFSTDTSVEDTTYEKRSAIKITLFLAIVTLFISVVFIPSVYNLLPDKLSKISTSIRTAIGIEQKLPISVLPSTQVEVIEYPNRYDEKIINGKRTVIISGIVKNISEASLNNICIQIELFDRESANALPETRIIPLKPSLLFPKQEGHYNFEIKDKDYLSSRFVKVLVEGKEIPFINSKNYSQKKTH